MSVAWGEITAEKIIAPIKGSCVSGRLNTVFQGLGTDSRKIGHGDLFWALNGERFDGHDFIEKALQQGAVGVVAQNDYWQSGQGEKVLKALSSNAVVITVEDSLGALGDLAGWWRRQHRVRAIAITGSAGKTTTKEMTASILELGERTLKNEGNFNNLIGLPLTLFRLNRDHRKAVLEMGMNRPGEIARLTEIADPDVGLITNVGMAHLAGLGDLEGVAKAKTELIDRISPLAHVILNGDDKLLMKTAARSGREVMTFGLEEESALRAVNIRNSGREGITFDMVHQGDSWPVRLRLPGLQNVANALAAAAVCLCLNIPQDHIVEGLGRYAGLDGRFKVTHLPYGAILIDDTYNANPLSLKAALESVSALNEEGGRMIVGLGEMMELGDAAVSAHYEAGRMVAGVGVDYFLTVGEHANQMVEGAVKCGLPRSCVSKVKDHEEMLRKLIGDVKTGDVIFLKGSRKMALDKVADGLKRFQT